MLANGTTAIIFPLRAKLNRLFAQQRPKVYGGRRVVVLPVLPWVDGDRPPNLDYGRVKGVPTLDMNCWVGFGLSGIRAQAIPLQVYQTPILRPSFGGKLTPDVVHALKPMPATFKTLWGISRDSTGAVSPNATVKMFRTADDVKQETMISNGDGYYYFKGGLPGVTYYVLGYKAGSPDITGATVNTLTAT